MRQLNSLIPVAWSDPILTPAFNAYCTDLEHTNTVSSQLLVESADAAVKGLSLPAEQLRATVYAVRT